MSNDPWSIFNPQPVSQAGQSVAPVDPWAAFNPKPVGQATAPDGRDLGAQSAFSHGILTGVPILGPLLEKAEGYVGSHIGSAISGKPVEQVLAEGQALGNATAEAHPVASTAGGVVGATMALGPAIEAAPALFGAGPGALTVGKVAAGLGSGAVIGGTDAGIRSGGDPSEIVKGSVYGGLGGAAGPVVGAGLGRVAEAATDAIAQRRALSGVGVSRPAAEILTRAAEADGTITGQGAANIQAAGPDAMLADAGPGSQNVLDTALQRGGPGAVAARQAVEQRSAAADQDLSGAMDSAFGPPQGIQTATNDIRNSTAGARRDAYDTAYAAPIDYSTGVGQDLESMVRNRVPAGIVARANAQMRLDGDTSGQILARIGDDGAVTYERLPDVRQLDYITRSLRDIAQRGDGQGALGGNTSEGRSYGNLARDLRDALKQAVPEYGTALDTAAQPIQARNALDFGAGLLSPSVPRDVAAETLQAMTKQELRQAKAGFRSATAETIANVTRTVTDPNVDARQAISVIKQLSSDAAQQKIALLISKNEQDALNLAITRATRALELRASVAGNSKTFVRGMTNEAVQRAAAPGVVGRALQGEPLKAGKAFVQFASGRTPADISRREDAIYSELSDALTRHRGQDAIDFYTRLQNAHQTRAAANAWARNLPYGQAASAGILGSILGSRAR